MKFELPRKIISWLNLRCRPWLSLMFPVCLFVASASATQVTNTTQSALMTALAGGGTVTFTVDGTINLSQTLIIATNVVLDGVGHNVSINGSNGVRVFFVNPGINFTVKNLSVIKGSVVGTNSTNVASGAGIYNNTGIVAVVNCVFSSNMAVGFGPNATGSAAAGGAIYNQSGTLNITNSTFLTNSATGGKAGIIGSVAGNAYGGALCNNNGTLNVSGASFGGNSSLGGTDIGSASGGSGNSLGSAFGGAVFTTNGSVMILNCRFYGNQALAQPVSYGNFSESSVGGANGGAVCQFGGTVTMLQSTLQANSATGGSFNRYNNTAGNGCGGALFSQGIFAATYCTFAGNGASGGSNGNLAGDGDGGAIFNMGTCSVFDCSFASNYVISGISGEGPFGGTTFSGTANGGGI